MVRITEGNHYSFINKLINFIEMEVIINIIIKLVIKTSIVNTLVIVVLDYYLLVDFIAFFSLEHQHQLYQMEMHHLFPFFIINFFFYHFFLIL